jgi:putative transposase
MNLFHKEGDFLAFEQVLGEGLKRYPVELLTYCLMHNHWHLVLRPTTDDALGKLMAWVGVTHVRRHHQHYHTRGGGHLYQGRFKSFPVQEDRHFLVLCRYVEANAVRAGLVNNVDEWRWNGSFARRQGNKSLALSPWPVDRPRNWTALLNDPLDNQQLEEFRTCVNRGRPNGDDAWVNQTADRLGLRFTLRRAGRPRKGENQ